MYNHINAKIHAMKGLMLKKEEYLYLLDQKDVRAIALYLKNKNSYNVSLKSLDENDVHRGHLEILLYNSLIYDALKIVLYLSRRDKKIFRFIFRQQEIKNLKKTIRYIKQKESLENIDKNTLFIHPISKINFDKLLAANNFVDLLEALKGTNFYGILSPLLKDGHLAIFESEMALDRYYYKRNIEQINKYYLKKELIELFGPIYDYKNIMYIYRGKKYYNMSKEDLYTNRIPCYHKINRHILDEMIEESNVDKIQDIINKTYYKDLLIVEDIHSELNYHKAMRRMSVKIINGSPNNLLPALAYIIMKEKEILDITSIVEGVRYKMSKEEVKKSLIVDLEG